VHASWKTLVKAPSNEVVLELLLSVVRARWRNEVLPNKATEAVVRGPGVMDSQNLGGSELLESCFLLRSCGERGPGGGPGDGAVPGRTYLLYSHLESYPRKLERSNWDMTGPGL